MTTDAAATAHDDTGAHVLTVATSAVVALVVGFGAMPVVNSIAYLGVQSARQFWVDGGDVESAFTTGIGFAIQFGLLLGGAGFLSQVHVGRGRRFLLPGWGVAIAIVLVLGWLGVLGFLSGIGGLAGPPRELPSGQALGRSLYNDYPFAAGFGVIGVLLAQVWLRHVAGRAVRVIRISLPVVAAVTATATVVALTYTAYNLHS